MASIDINSKNFLEYRFYPYREPGVVGETMLLTSAGYFPIRQINHQQPQLVWNGKDFVWTKVKRVIENVKIVRITFTNGSFLGCTLTQPFFIQDGSTTYELQAFELEPGMRLRFQHRLPIIRSGLRLDPTDLDDLTLDSVPLLYSLETRIAWFRLLVNHSSKLELVVDKESVVCTKVLTSCETKSDKLSGDNGDLTCNKPNECVCDVPCEITTVVDTPIYSLRLIINISNPDNLQDTFYLLQTLSYVNPLIKRAESKVVLDDSWGIIRLFGMAHLTIDPLILGIINQRVCSPCVRIESVTIEPEDSFEVYHFYEPIRATGIFNGILSSGV